MSSSFPDSFLKQWFSTFLMSGHRFPLINLCLRSLCFSLPSSPTHSISSGWRWTLKHLSPYEHLPFRKCVQIIASFLSGVLGLLFSSSVDWKVTSLLLRTSFSRLMLLDNIRGLSLLVCDLCLCILSFLELTDGLELLRYFSCTFLPLVVSISYLLVELLFVCLLSRESS